MNKEYIEHIALYKDVYPEGYCQHLISEFNRLEEGGAGSNRLRAEGAQKHLKDDHQITLELRNHGATRFNNKHVCDVFFDGLQQCYDDYSEKYSVLKDAGNIRATVITRASSTTTATYKSRGRVVNRACVAAITAAITACTTTTSAKIISWRN